MTRGQQEYREVIDRAFARYFPDWNQLSPLDPVKIFTESLAGSLAEVEARQGRYVDTLLDTLPSLFSFAPKPAELPRELFAFTPSVSLSEPKRLEAPQGFRFQGEKDVCLALPERPILLQPWSNFKQEDEAGIKRISFATRGACREIPLTFLPTPGHSARLTDVLVTIAAADKPPVPFFREDLGVKDETEQFSRLGELTLTPQKQNAAYFSSTPAQVSIEFHFRGDAPLAAQFVPNAVVCRLYREASETMLGNLEGIPWEEVPLSEEVVRPPERVDLQFPDDSLVTLARLPHDILKLRHSDPERFRQGFFYNAANHSLIIPQASHLMGRFTGGVRLIAPKLVMRPRFDRIPNDYKSNVSDFAAIIEKMTPVKALSPWAARETKSEYLNRFYTTMRLFSASAVPTPGLIEDEIASQVLNSSEALREVELSTDVSSKRLSVFVATYDADPAANSALPPLVTSKVSQTLSRIVPLDYQWKVSAFTAPALLFQIKLQLTLEEDRVGSVNENFLKQQIQEALAGMLSSRCLAPREKLSKEDIWKRLTRRLGQKASDGFPLKASEITSLRGLIQHGTPGERVYIDEINRSPGERYQIHVELECSYERKETTSKLSFARLVS